MRNIETGRLAGSLILRARADRMKELRSLGHSVIRAVKINDREFERRDFSKWQLAELIELADRIDIRFGNN